MTDIFLLGAGASYGSGDCAPNCPPLGARLFSELQKGGGVAATVEPQLAELFERNFELGMVAFRESRDRDTTALLRQMARYFVQFTAGPANAYHELLNIIRASGRTATLVTTNYDLLLEQAMTEGGMRVAYHGHPVPPGNVPLLKIHGSCHFLPDIGGGVMKGVTFSNNAVNLEANVRIERSRAAVVAFCENEDSLAPAIALYAPGKKVLFSPRIVAAQQQYWQDELAKADTVYVIGLRVLPDDDHIWGALAQCNARVEYVGREPDEFEQWCNVVGRANTHILATDFRSSLPLIRRQLQQ